jgi:branched-chain amino acid transport system substrate-binding protein
MTTVLVLSACAAPAAPSAAPAAEEGGAPAAEAKAEIKVGAIFDLTGPTSDVGTPYSQGIVDYVKWLNDNGGLDGHTVNLISQDYQYKVDQAEQLYSQFVNQENVVAFMGWGTGDTEALRSRIAADKIPFMSASYSANLAVIEEAPYNFLVGTTYSDQMIIALQWALQDWAEKGNEGAPKVAVLHHNSPFGKSPVPDGEAFAADNGIEFTAIAMPSGATDLTPELSQVQSFGGNYIIIQNVSSPAALLLKDAKRLGMEDVQVVCLNWCADENLINLAGDAAEGVVGTLPFTPPTVDVPGLADPRAFLEAQGKDLNEVGLHYSQGWWTMAVMTEGIRRVVANGDEITGENIRAALETLKDFDTGGVTAPITFTATDHRGNRSLRIFKVQDGQWQQASDYITAQ